MQCGFTKGNNKTFQTNLNQAVMDRFAKLFEADDDDDVEENPESLFSIAKPQQLIVPTKPKVEAKPLSPVKTIVKPPVQPQNDSNRSRVEKGFFLLTKPLQQSNTAPLYERNTLLLLKIRKLHRWLIGARMEELSRKQSKEVQLLSRQDVGLVTMRVFVQEEVPSNLIRNYFKSNYPTLMKGNKKQFAEWSEQQVSCLLPKLTAFTQNELCRHRSYNAYNLVRELEYRFYIQWVLQLRTIVQRIQSQDSPITQHLVLLVESVVYSSTQARYYVRLSDGWYRQHKQQMSRYPLYLIVDFRTGNTGDRYLGELIQKNKISPGVKVDLTIKNKKQIHTMNLQRYPVMIDASKIVKDEQPLLCCGSANSIKRARWDAKLGQQEQPYYLRSVRSLKSFGGVVPCVDLFVLSVSYLIEGFGVTRCVVDTDTQEELSKPRSFYWCVLKCIDSLHHFDKTEPDRIVNLTVRYIPQPAYESIQQGDRIRAVNCEVTSVIENYVSLSVKCSPVSGVITQDLKQYPTFGKSQIQRLVKIFDTTSKKQQRCDVVLFVTEFTKENEITGLTISNMVVKVQLHLPQFFGKFVNSKRLLHETVIITDVIVRSLLLNFPPFIGYCTTTDQSRVILSNRHWVEKYNTALEELSSLRH